MKWIAGEIEGVERRRLTRHTDARGCLMEMFRTDEIAPDLVPAMGYISVTHPGVARGPHEHRAQTDIFAFLGPGTFAVIMWDNRPASPTCGHRLVFEAGERAPTVVIVPPGVVHGYRNVSSIDAWVLNFPNRLYAGKGRTAPVDEIRHENEPGTEFNMDQCAVAKQAKG